MNKTYYTRAREVFGKYETMDTPDLPEDPLSALQIRLYRWGNQFSGLDGSLATVLGQGEEIGELVESVCGSLDDGMSFTKMTSDIWERNAVTGMAEDTLDAIGDILIYSTQMCTGLRMDFGTLLRSGKDLEHLLVAAGNQPTASVPIVGWDMLGLTAAVGRIQHALLKNKQKLRGYDDELKFRTEVADSTVHLCRFCTRICTALGVDLLDVYFRVSEKVMKRNWKKDAITGGQV